MLGGWLHDAGGGGDSESVALPFARGGRSSSAASSQPRGGHQQQHAGAGQLQPPLRRPHYPSPEGPVFDLDPSSVVEAHRHAAAAEEARRDGRLQESLQEHVEAARCFLEAAERLPDVNGVTGAALVLLSDGHARQAKILQHVLRRSSDGPRRKRPLPTALQQQQQAAPTPSASPPPPVGSSMYGSALAPPAPEKGERGTTGAAQVDDMLALERCLAAIGSQPVFSGGASFHHGHGHAGAGGEGHGLGGAAGGGGLGGAARYLSSTLGDSFFLVSTRHAANREAAWSEGSSAMLGSVSARPKGPAGAGGGGLRMDAAAQAALRGSRISGGGNNGGAQMPRASSSTSLAGGVGGGSTSSASSGGSAGGRPGGAATVTTASAAPVGHGGSSSSSRGGGGGGFLDGVESVQQGEVMRLLGCMKTLGDENAALIKQAEEGQRARQENERLRREMGEFKELYASRFKQLRAALEDFRQRYPHELNPANHVASSRDQARIKTLEAEVEALYGRLNKERAENKKHAAVIRRYEQWYKTLKASAQTKRMHTAQQQQQATQAAQRNAAAAAGVASASSSSSSSGSGMRPPGRA